MKKLILAACLLLAGSGVYAQAKIFTGGALMVGATPSAPPTSFKFHTVGDGVFTSTSTIPTSAPMIRGRDGYGTAFIPEFTWFGNDQTGMFHPGANIIGFTIGGTEKMRIHSNGYVGIGRTSPAYPLDVSGDINLYGLSSGIRISSGYVLQIKNNSTNIFAGLYAGSNTTGNDNTAVGAYALNTNSSGAGSTAVGSNALTTSNANYCAAFGFNTLSSSTGAYNSAFGADALASNGSSILNSAFGYRSLYNSTGAQNTGFGGYALYSVSTGSANCAAGYSAGYWNTGSRNTAFGYGALQGSSGASGSYNTAVGYNAGTGNTSGTYNTYVGYMATANSATFTNSAAFGNGASATGSNQIAIGNTFITKIEGQVQFSTFSDGRFKTNVQENVPGLELIEKLRAVTYNIDTKQLDDFIIQNMPDSIKQLHQAGVDFTNSSGITHSGFIAQEVEQAAQQVGFQSTIVNPPANSTDPYSISYAELVVPIVKSIQQLRDSLTHIRQQLNACCHSTDEQRSLDKGNNDKNNDAGNVNEHSANAAAKLWQNIPNPFNQTTNIKCFVPEQSKTASLMIFDLTGALKKTVSIGGTGEVNVTLHAKELVAGMYHYSLIVDGQEIDTKKMILTE